MTSPIRVRSSDLPDLCSSAAACLRAPPATHHGNRAAPLKAAPLEGGAGAGANSCPLLASHNAVRNADRARRFSFSAASSNNLNNNTALLHKRGFRLRRAKWKIRG